MDLLGFFVNTISIMTLLFISQNSKFFISLTYTKCNEINIALYSKGCLYVIPQKLEDL